MPTSSRPSDVPRTDSALNFFTHAISICYCRSQTLNCTSLPAIYASVVPADTMQCTVQFTCPLCQQTLCNAQCSSRVRCASRHYAMHSAVHVSVVSADTMQCTVQFTCPLCQQTLNVMHSAVHVSATNTTVGRNGRLLMALRFRHKVDDKNRTHGGAPPPPSPGFCRIVRSRPSKPQRNVRGITWHENSAFCHPLCLR